MKSRILLFFLIFTLIMNFTSCNSSDSSYAFKYAISGNPKTLDPQCALNDSSDAVISAVFQGLFKSEADGDITSGMIDGYNVSDDGTVWTFQLKQGIFWSDGADFSAECTAEDYVFAFQRLFRPETKSERAAEYFVIKNSKAINSGAISDMSLLGVKTTGKYTLEIVLENPCSDFKNLLSLSPAMPCNEQFFESTQGRYGLAADCVASNNGYYIHTWNYDKWSDEGNYIILRRNKLNSYSDTSPYTINLFIDPVNERKDFDEKILKVYKGKNYEEITELKKIYDYSEYETGVWGFIFNLDGKFSNQNYRLELSWATDFTESDDRYSAFTGVVPHYIKCGDSVYRENAVEKSGTVITDSQVGALSGMKMLMPTGTGLRTEIGKILQGWQTDCNFYCSISELDLAEYNNSLKNGDFDIALVKLSGEYNSPYAYLSEFLYDNSENYSGYKNRKYSHIINSALTSADEKQALIYYREAEQLLLDSGVFVPLCIETEYVFYDEKSEGITYNPFSDTYEVF